MLTHYPPHCSGLHKSAPLFPPLLLTAKDLIMCAQKDTAMRKGPRPAGTCAQSQLFAERRFIKINVRGNIHNEVT